MQTDPVLWSSQIPQSESTIPSFRWWIIFSMLLCEPKSLRRVGEFSTPMNIWVNLYSPRDVFLFALKTLRGKLREERAFAIKRHELKNSSLLTGEILTWCSSNDRCDH